MIYVAHILDGQFVKIGYCAKSPEFIIASLQNGCPFQIKKLFAVNGSLIQEQELHRQLKKSLEGKRMCLPANEWYACKSDFFAGFLVNLAESVNIGLAYLDSVDPSVTQPRHEIRLFKYGTQESIDQYLSRSTAVVWPKAESGTPKSRELSRKVVEFFGNCQ